MTENKYCPLFFNRRYAIDLNVKRARPCNDAYKYARRRYTWEIARINLIYRSEFLDRSAIDIALQNVPERRTRRIQAQFHLFKDHFRLPLN
jgi:hypothetical protein